MDDHSDVSSDHSADLVYNILPPLQKRAVLSASAYGSGIVPNKSYSEAQQMRAEQLMKMTNPTEQHTTQATLIPSIADDTVHYMSPVSPLSDRTCYEGDYDYYQHMFKVRTERARREKAAGDRDTLEGLSMQSESTVSCVLPELQRTVAIVKPDAMRYEDVIIRAVKEAGFTILNSRQIHLSPEQVSEIYAQYYGTPAFPQMVVSMSVSPVRVLTLAGINAVAKWRDIAGPEGTLREEWFYPISMQKRFGIRASMPNAVKASENMIESDKENRYFSPDSILEPLIQDLDKVTDYCGLYVNPTLVNGLAELLRVKPIDPVLFLAEWLLLNNPFQPRFPKDIAMVPT